MKSGTGDGVFIDMNDYEGMNKAYSESKCQGTFRSYVVNRNKTLRYFTFIIFSLSRQLSRAIGVTSERGVRCKSIPSSFLFTCYDRFLLYNYIGMIILIYYILLP